MNGIIRGVLGVVFILVIVFGVISIVENTCSGWKVDATEKKLYSLSPGTKAILGKLNQPIRFKLYYAKTAAMKAPDQIKFFNNYYEFVKSLLEEYVAVSKGMVQLEIIDPRPFSEQEVEAIRYGLKKFPITEEETFFFGLVLQTQFGVEKTIPFFSPDRQTFVEYDISYLIDTAITRQKKVIGILTSTSVMGDDVSGYMAQMMQMQGQQPRPPWTIVEHLRQQYEVRRVPTDANEINDIDVLLVVHPKNLSERTQFAIDQFILKGGRTIICVDPYSFADQPSPAMQRFGQISQSSNLNRLLRTWGLETQDLTFAGDRALALSASITTGQRPEKIIGFLALTAPDCFNRDSVITAELNQVRVLFAGVLNEIPASADANAPQIVRTPLITTTARGNSFKADSQFELSMLDAESFMKRFIDGVKPVTLGYLITGRLKSSFPDGIDVVEAKQDEQEGETDASKSPSKIHITGLTEAQQDCAVAVFADVDFISDLMAYQNTIFGKIVVADNSALLLNAIEALSGSGELISIRSRGNVRRPFTVVDKIEAEAEAQTAEEVAKLNAEIAGFENELRALLTSTKEEEKQIIGSSVVQKTRDLEVKKRAAQQRLRDVKMLQRQRKERLGSVLRAFNMLAAPAVILVIAIILSVRRSVMKRHYISHASDA